MDAKKQLTAELLTLLLSGKKLELIQYSHTTHHKFFTGIVTIGGKEFKAIFYRQEYSSDISLSIPGNSALPLLRMFSNQHTVGSESTIEECRIVFQKDLEHGSEETKLCVFLHKQLKGRIQKLWKEQKVQATFAHPRSTYPLHKVA